MEQVVHSQDGWDVTYSSAHICALKGSTVEIHCSYRYPAEKDGQKTRVRRAFWFSKDSNNIYVDLRTDLEYSGRVQYHYGNNSCTLRITDLRKSDSAEYKFRFTTNQPGERYTGSPGVTLSVADLQVSRSINWGSNSARLKCQSSCPLANPQSYIWYSNGKTINRETSQFYVSYFHPTNRLSCAVNGHENSPSPSVLVRDAWDVTYSSTQICACKGSTVEMHCSYTHPLGKSVTETFWFAKMKDGKYAKLKDDPQYAGRVEYDQKSCRLTIRNLTESDSAEYKFRFITNKGGKLTGLPGVTLSVKDPQLQVHVSRSVNRFSTRIQLTCQSSCQQSGYSSYNWYNNSIKVQEGKRYLHLQTFGPSDSYYCSVRGQESFRSHAVYAPKLPSVSVSPSAEIVEGSSVNLTCSSDANPAANYTWYKEDEDSPKVSGQNFTITDFRAKHSGKYSCEAQNIVGRHTVSVHLAVLGGSWKAAAAGATTAVTLPVVFLFVFIMMRKKRRSEQSTDPVQRTDNREQDDLHYASIQFSKNLQESLYSNTRSAEPQRHVEKEDQGVVYSGVKYNIRGQETGEDSAALYSTVKKTH